MIIPASWPVRVKNEHALMTIDLGIVAADAIGQFADLHVCGQCGNVFVHGFGHHDLLQDVGFIFLVDMHSPRRASFSVMMEAPGIRHMAIPSAITLTSMRGSTEL